MVKRLTLPREERLARLRVAAEPGCIERGFLRLGGFQRPGRRLEVNNRCLELDGRPWLPVMGEFHFSRYPEGEWETELRRMRAGGMDIVASYVMWNHHEAVEGRFDWSGRRDLRRFVKLAHEAGLHFYLRPGPWVHAEVRYGGFPDWLVTSGVPLRCNDAAYLSRVRRYFDEIGAQLQGLMWCDGGPVIGVQLENEYDGTGPGRGAEHILELKRLAIAAGLTVPLYTVTGWPTLDIPERDVVPVSGAYPDGFWSGETGVLPPSGVFQFNTSRAIGEMGNVSGVAAAHRIDRLHYPFFLAEAGGGMHVSYHRRPVVSADDVAATCLVQVGNGATLYGYYMYHGGTNPQGPAGRLHETQATGYPNDVPVLGYDFHAPLGQYGQIRPSYDRLRTLHLFLAAFGAELAPMESSLPVGASADPGERDRLRVALRGQGRSGFLFVNNHVRHHPMPSFRGRLEVSAGDVPPLLLPSREIEIPDGAYFIWSLGQALGAACMRYATMQPLTRLDEAGRCTWVAFAHPAIEPELSFDADSITRIDADPSWIERSGADVLLRPRMQALPCWIHLTDRNDVEHALLLLDRELAEHCYRLPVAGRDRLVLCEEAVHVEADGHLAVGRRNDTPAFVRVYPGDDLAGAAHQDGFACYAMAPPVARQVTVSAVVVHDNPVPPPLRMGPHVPWRKGPVPLAPDDAEFEDATRIDVHVDAPVPPEGERLMLEIDYVGDVARLYADGELVDDHFHDGETWCVGIDRYARHGAWPRFELRICAADPAAPIFREPAAMRRLAEAGGGARLQKLKATVWSTARLELRSPCEQSDASVASTK